MEDEACCEAPGVVLSSFEAFKVLICACKQMHGKDNIDHFGLKKGVNLHTGIFLIEHTAGVKVPQ